MKKFYLSCYFILLLFSFTVNAQTPVAHYPFNGNANDAIGTLNGTVSGAILATDRFGNASTAFRFDGVDDNIDLSNSNVIRPTAALTISAWFNLENPAGAIAGRQILSCTENSGYQIAYDKALNAFVLYVRRNGSYGFVQTPAAPYLTGWHFMTGTFDGRFTRLYMDGILVGTDDAGATFPVQYFSGVKTYIGAEASDPIATGVPIDINYYWQGRIDEVKIYSTALTAPQILQEFTTNVGPVAHYPFNGNANDAIGTNHGTASGGAALTTDRFGNTNSAYNFDGVDDFISTANLATNQTDNWTMMAWVKPVSINQFQGSILLNGFDNGGGGSNGFSMVMSDNAGSNGNLLMGYFGAVAIHSSGGVFATNNIWYHVAMLRQSGTVRYYINGVQTSNTYTGTINTPVGTVLIGAQNGHRFWNGAIDEVKIYNKALTASQIQQDFASSNQTQKPGSGNAMSFNGTTQSITMPNSSAINFGTGDFSVDFWYNSLVSKEEIIFDKRDDNCADGPNWAIRKNLAGEVFFEVNVPGPSSDFVVIPNVSDGKWHHIAFIRTATQISAFKDGMLAESKAAITQNVSNSANFQLGTGPCSPFLAGGGFFSGSLDEIKMWNIALTQSQIRDRMCKKITSTDPLYTNLVAYYNFDESTGTTAFDGTINANNGTLVNTPTRITSGAAIGNASSHDYVNATKTVSLTHPAGENFTVISTSGLPAGIQVYMVDEKPSTLTGASGVGDNNKYFGVFQAGGTTPQYTAVYNYNGNPFVTPAIESQLRLNKRTDNTGTWSTMITTPNEPANTITVTGESTEYILGRLGGALPLNLISFSGSKQNNDALLQWKTANEVNVNRFEIQRSENGFDFITVGSVNAGSTFYSFADVNTFITKQIVYYRLKSIDADGKFTYSGIVKLSNEQDGRFTIFPNPVKDIITISGLKQNGTLILFTADGKLLQQQKVNTQSITMDLSSYATGTYLLQYENEGVRHTQKLIKH